jgi:hypothetical protein
MSSSPSIPTSRRPRQISQWVISLGVPWAILTLSLATLSEPTQENLTLFFAILGSGVYTLILRATRRFWLPRLAARPLRNAALAGIFNAVVIETLFLILEKLFGAEGIAAHPNLLLDLILTMPWYIMMVITFTQVQHRRRFSSATVLLLGAVYETGADGIVAQVIGIPFGDTQLFSPAYWVMLMGLIFWQFILVYSSMVLPTAWILDTVPRPAGEDGSPIRDALRPLLWLGPFTVYLFLLLIILGAITGGL